MAEERLIRLASMGNADVISDTDFFRCVDEAADLLASWDHANNQRTTYHGTVGRNP